MASALLTSKGTLIGRRECLCFKMISPTKTMREVGAAIQIQKKEDLQARIGHFCCISHCLGWTWGTSPSRISHLLAWILLSRWITERLRIKVPFRIKRRLMEIAMWQMIILSPTSKTLSSSIYLKEGVVRSLKNALHHLWRMKDNLAPLSLWWILTMKKWSNLRTTKFTFNQQVVQWLQGFHRTMEENRIWALWSKMMYPETILNEIRNVFKTRSKILMMRLLSCKELC